MQLHGMEQKNRKGGKEGKRERRGKEEEGGKKRGGERREGVQVQQLTTEHTQKSAIWERKGKPTHPHPNKKRPAFSLGNGNGAFQASRISPLGPRNRGEPRGGGGRGEVAG